MENLSDWHALFSLQELFHFVTTSLVAVFCGVIIGLERESKGKPAGLRTLVLICLGSSMIVQVSLILADGRGDPSRVAAQIVSGIGFLGAGAILQHSEHGYVAGLTTAASIWVTAAVGMLVGSGHYLVSIAGVSIVVLALRFLKKAEGLFFQNNGVEFKKIYFESRSGKARWAIHSLLEDNLIRLDEYKFVELPDEEPFLEFKYVHKNRNHRNFLAEVASLPQTLRIS